MSNKPPTIENIEFDKLCMIGDIEAINQYAKKHSGQLDYYGSYDPTENDYYNDTNILVYKLVCNNKIDVLHYLYTTPYISGIPDLHFWINGKGLSALEILYMNGHTDFIKTLLTDKTLKDNLILSCYKMEKLENGSFIKTERSYFFELVIREKDYAFADFLLNNQDIKYSISHFSSIRYAIIEQNINKVKTDKKFIKELLKMSHKFFNSTTEPISFSWIAYRTTGNFDLPIQVQHTIIDILYNLKYLNNIHEMKDMNEDTLLLSKYVLQKRLDDKLKNNIIIHPIKNKI